MKAVNMLCGDVRSLTVALTEGEKRRGLASATTSLEPGTREFVVWLQSWMFSPKPLWTH